MLRNDHHGVPAQRAGLEEIHRQEIETLMLEHRRSIEQLREVQIRELAAHGYADCIAPLTAGHGEERKVEPEFSTALADRSAAKCHSVGAGRAI